MRVFIGGVMQGSKRGKDINDQSYRQAITRIVKTWHPEAEIVDPQALFPNSVAFDDARARQVLFDMIEEAGRADIVVAYLPEASMGTALEMVRAHDIGTPVISISPMYQNWVIRTLSQHIFPSLEAFGDWVKAGGLDKTVSANDEKRKF